MNPILKETIKDIKKHMILSEAEEGFLALEIGNAMMRVAHGCITNPNFNLNGGDSADENSYVSKKDVMGIKFDIN